VLKNDDGAEKSLSAESQLLPDGKIGNLLPSSLQYEKLKTYLLVKFTSFVTTGLPNRMWHLTTIW